MRSCPAPPLRRSSPALPSMTLSRALPIAVSAPEVPDQSFVEKVASSPPGAVGGWTGGVVDGGVVAGLMRAAMSDHGTNLKLLVAPPLLLLSWTTSMPSEN